MKWNQGYLAKRVVLAGLIVGSGVLAASAYAVSTDRAEDKSRCESRHGQQGAGEREEKRAAHLSGLKEKLKLTAEQELTWNAFIAAAQPEQRHAGRDRKAMRDELDKLNTPQRVDRMLAMSDMRRASMVARAEAVKAFYAQLRPEQQSVFDAEAMPRIGHRGHQRHQS